MEKKDEVKKQRKSKKWLIILIIILLILLALGGAGYYYYTYLVKQQDEKIQDIYNKNNQALHEFSETIEYGTQISYEELLNKVVDINLLQENTNIKLYINDQEIQTETNYKFETVGNYSIKVELTKKYEYTLIKQIHKTIENIKNCEIKVEDTKNPVITGVSDKEIIVGDEINLSEGISATDEIDGQLEVTIEGNVDNQKAGEYTIKAKAIDKNGNVAEQEFKVTVKEKTVAKTNTTTSSNKSSNSTSTNKTTSSKTNSSSNSTSSSSSSSSSKSSTSTTTSSNDSSTKDGRLKIATAEAKRVVSNIIKPGMSAYSKAEAIFNYLHSNVETQHNQSNEAYKTNYGNEAYAALIMKKAACSGFCKAVTLMCNAAGLQSKHLNAGEWTHQWNTVLIDGQWIVLDAQGGIFGGTVHPLEY